MSMVNGPSDAGIVDANVPSGVTFVPLPLSVTVTPVSVLPSTATFGPSTVAPSVGVVSVSVGGNVSKTIVRGNALARSSPRTTVTTMVFEPFASVTVDWNLPSASTPGAAARTPFTATSMRGSPPSANDGNRPDTT